MTRWTGTVDIYYIDEATGKEAGWRWGPPKSKQGKEFPYRSARKAVDFLREFMDSTRVPRVTRMVMTVYPEPRKR